MLDEESAIEADRKALEELYEFEADSREVAGDTRWLNKQRTLVVCSRSIKHLHRHLMLDIRRLLPHHKSESKIERHGGLQALNELAQFKNCNNITYLEARRNGDVFMWISRSPMGPSVKFAVFNVHTMGEMRMTGNHMLGSRPFLLFDLAFDRREELSIIKELFIQGWGTPRNHPESKPFFDHVFAFNWVDDKIYFRHYQISPATERDANQPSRQLLTEVGPRFALEPLKVFGGSFCGKVLWKKC